DEAVHLLLEDGELGGARREQVALEGGVVLVLVGGPPALPGVGIARVGGGDGGGAAAGHVRQGGGGAAADGGGLGVAADQVHQRPRRQLVRHRPHRADGRYARRLALLPLAVDRQL